MKTLLAMVLATVPVCVRSAPVMEAVDGKMEEFVRKHEVAGVVTLVADREKTLHFSATGHADAEEKREMKEDGIFWVASMTKPVTATAVMMLVEEGRLSMDDSIAIYLPEFRELKDAAGNEVTVTLGQCLAHTSGMAELSAEESAGVVTLEEAIRKVAVKPVQFTPGSEWRYCQSSINTAARIVEVVSGEAFPEFLEKRLFGPLGMRDTSFYLTEEQLPRLAASYARDGEGGLKKVPLGFLAGKAPTSKDRFPRANGGLFSTAEDFGKFARMILRGGELDGRRYLKAESVREMTSLQTGDLVTGFTPGNGWGHGWCVIREPQGVSGALSAGSFGHGGAYGTQMWIDPEAGRVFLLMVQRADFPNSDASDVRRAFQDAVAGVAE